MKLTHKFTRRQLLVLSGQTVLGLGVAGCGAIGKKKKKSAKDAAVPVTPVEPTPQASADANEPVSQFSAAIEGEWRRLTGNGIPNHPHGEFPNAHDPEALREQHYNLLVSASPQKAEATQTLTPIGLQTYMFGMAVNGVPIDPSGPWFHAKDGNVDWHFDATGDLGRVYLGLDTHNAHTQAGGRYHYHGVPVGLIAKLRETQPTGMLLLGWGADGFPIYANSVPQDPADASSPLVAVQASYRLREGTRPSAPGGLFDGTFEQDHEYVAGLGELDECNGREGPTPEFPEGTYYYVLTEQFPYVPRLLRGTPHESFVYGPKGTPATDTSPGTPGGGKAPTPREMRNYVPKEG